MTKTKVKKLKVFLWWIIWLFVIKLINIIELKAVHYTIISFVKNLEKKTIFIIKNMIKYDKPFILYSKYHYLYMLVIL